MASAQDPTDPLRKKAMTFPDVIEGMSCNQSSFKAGKGTFLFIGPGAKGQGVKAMFKLGDSIPEAKKLAAKDPQRFEVGNTSWVTTRFTKEKPLPKTLWQKWMKESYGLTCGAGAGGKQKAVKRVTNKKRARKKPAKKKAAH